MMNTLVRGAVAIAFVLLPFTPVSANIQSTGVIEPFPDPTICLQGSHIITDLCTGRAELLDEFWIDLDPFVCQHVFVEGPNVGVECRIIGPTTVSVTEPQCSTQIRDLVVSGQIDTQARWSRVPCAAAHDLIRGDLSSLRPDGDQIDLGAVVCVGDDLAERFLGLPITGPPDPDIPEPGIVFFYLARGNHAPFGGDTYGAATGGEIRVPTGGDCPL